MLRMQQDPLWVTQSSSSTNRGPKKSQMLLQMLESSDVWNFEFLTGTDSITEKAIGWNFIVHEEAKNQIITDMTRANKS